MIQFLGRDQTGLPGLFGQFFPLHTERTLGQPFLTDTNFNHLPQHQEFQIKRTSANRGFFLSLYLLFNFGLGLGANPSSPLRKSKSRLIVNRVEAMLPPKIRRVWSARNSLFHRLPDLYPSKLPGPFCESSGVLVPASTCSGTDVSAGLLRVPARCCAFSTCCAVTA